MLEGKASFERPNWWLLILSGRIDNLEVLKLIPDDSTVNSQSEQTMDNVTR